MGKQSAKFDTLLLAINLLIMGTYCIITTYTDSEFSISVFDGGTGSYFACVTALIAAAATIAVGSILESNWQLHLPKNCSVLLLANSIVCILAFLLCTKYAADGAYLLAEADEQGQVLGFMELTLNDLLIPFLHMWAVALGVTIGILLFGFQNSKLPKYVWSGLLLIIGAVLTTYGIIVMVWYGHFGIGAETFDSEWISSQNISFWLWQAFLPPTVCGGAVFVLGIVSVIKKADLFSGRMFSGKSQSGAVENKSYYAVFDTGFLLLAVLMASGAVVCRTVTLLLPVGGYLWPLFRVGGIILAIAGVIAIFYSAYCGKQKC